MLELKSITKDFPGTRALENVSLSVRGGEVVALLGENGAGKSTLMKILSGVWPAGSFDGELRVAGRPCAFGDTRDAFGAGIAMIHQELAVFPELTVAEHLELDRLPGWIDWSALEERTGKFLREMDFGLAPRMRVGDLSIGGRQLVEIARALYRDARILVFDEPTSALTDSEVQRLYAWIDRLRAQGRAIIYITHRMDEVFRLADRLVVLRDGKNAGEHSAWKADGVRFSRSELEPRLIREMVGREIQDLYPARNAAIGEELLSVRELSLTGPGGKKLLDGMSFSIRRGEVLGLAGLLGAGRSETFEALFGMLHSAGPRGPGFESSGEVRVNGRTVSAGTPREAIELRMAFVSEDRKGNGLVLGQSIRTNISLPALAASRADTASGRGWFRFVKEENERSASSHWAREFRVRSAHLDQAVGELSGGNQQKVVLAKWLLTEPEILFLDEPTRGVDVGAKAEIYQWIQRLAAQGMAVVVASSEMPELLGLCHRIAVMRDGKVTAEFGAEQATQEAILRAATQ